MPFVPDQAMGFVPDEEPAGSPVNPRRYTNPNRSKSSGELAAGGAKKFAGDLMLGVAQVANEIPAFFGRESALQNRNAMEGIADARKLDPVMRTTAGKVGYTGAALVPAVAAGFIPGANTVVGGGLIGAGMGAAQPTGTGDSRVANTAIGVGAGAIGQGIANTIGRIAQPITRSLGSADDDAVRLLQEQGVNLRPGQQTGSRAAKGIERSLFDNPISAPKMERAAQEQARQYTRAALRTIGVNADNASPEVLSAARTRITGVLDEIGTKYAPDINEIAPDLATLKSEADMLSDFGKPITNLIARIEDDAANGRLTGELVAKYRTALGRLSKNEYVGGLAADLDEVLSNGMQSAMRGTDDFVRYAQARTNYRDLKAIESAVQNVADAQVPAGTLASRMSTSRFTKDAFKYGTGDQALPKLARAGSTVIDRTPNSGTAQRAAALAVPGILGGAIGYGQEGDPSKAALYAALGLLAPRAGAAMFTNPMMANYLGQGLSGTARGLLTAPGRLPIGSMAAAGLLTAQ